MTRIYVAQDRNVKLVYVAQFGGWWSFTARQWKEWLEKSQINSVISPGAWERWSGNPAGGIPPGRT